MIHQRFILFLVLTGSTLTLALSGSTLWYLNSLVNDLPALEAGFTELSPTSLPLATEVFDRTGKKIGEFASERRYYIPLQHIPKQLVNAFLSAEDKEFFTHRGISFKAILRAFSKNMASGDIREGGSTITQQLVRTIYLSRERSFNRKIKEAILAVVVERKLSKEKILELYLNTIFLGNRSYGIEAASRNYFRKQVKDLTVGEMAMLAGLPKAPSKYAPHRNYRAAKKRQAHILNSMEDNGYLTAEDAKTWKKTKIEVAVAPENHGKKAPYFLQHVREILQRSFEFRDLPKDGLRIFTTLDPALQKAQQVQLYGSMNKLNKNLSFRLQATDRIESAMVSIDPATGAVLTLNGGSHFPRSQFNRAISTHRRIGHLFMPILFASALEKGFTLASPLNHIPLQGGSREKRHLTPSIYEALLSGLAYESARVYGTIGAGSVRKFSERLGLNFTRQDFSVAIGYGEATPLSIGTAYASFANGGELIRPYYIDRIEDLSGKVLYQHKQLKRPSALRPETAFIMNTALQHVVEEGVADRAKGIHPGIAGMAGATDDRHNGWFVAYQPRLLTVTWVGAENGGITIGQDDWEAAEVAIDVWRGFAKRAGDLKRFDEPLGVPQRVSYARVDTFSDKRQSLPFVTGTEPKAF